MADYPATSLTRSKRGVYTDTPVVQVDIGGTGGQSLLGDSGVSLPINDNNSSITVDGEVSIDGSVAVTNIGVFRVQVTSLPVNTGFIGKLSSNNGVDIGDVTINNTSLSVDVLGTSHSVSASQLTSSGDTTLIAAPGSGDQLKILRVEASNSSTSAAVTVGLKNASLNGGSVFGKKYLPASGGMATWVFPSGYLLCGDNEAFVGNLSGVGQVEFTVYYIEI